MATNTCNALWYQSYWGYYWGNPWNDAWEWDEPGWGTTTVGYAGCSQWRAVLAFSFMAAITYLISSILVSAVLLFPRLTRTMTDPMTGFDCCGQVLRRRSQEQEEPVSTSQILSHFLYPSTTASDPGVVRRRANIVVVLTRVQNYQ